MLSVNSIYKSFDCILICCSSVVKHRTLFNFYLILSVLIDSVSEITHGGSLALLSLDRD